MDDGPPGSNTTMCRTLEECIPQPTLALGT